MYFILRVLYQRFHCTQIVEVNMVVCKLTFILVSFGLTDALLLGSGSPTLPTEVSLHSSVYTSDDHYQISLSTNLDGVVLEVVVVVTVGVSSASSTALVGVVSKSDSPVGVVSAGSSGSGGVGRSYMTREGRVLLSRIMGFNIIMCTQEDRLWYWT